MRGYRLLDEVGIAELREMREQGLTNREIAERLDVSYYTIVKHLGKCPFRHKEPRTEEPVDITPAPVTIGCLKVLSSVVTLQGELTKYTVNTEAGTVLMEDGLLRGVLDKDTLGDAIRELEEVRRMLLAR